MIRVGEFSSEINQTRKRFWLEALKLPLQWIEFSPERLLEPAALLKNRDVDGVMVPVWDSDLLLQSSTKIPTEVRECGMVDAVIQQQGQLWIRCFLREALHQLILKTAPQLDTHSIVYVTGSDPQARMCVATAVKMGFQKVVLIAEDLDQAKEIGEQISKNFFGVNFRYLRETELTLQPNNGSLLLNTLSEETGGIVFEDLTYLNFLRKDGLVVHLPLHHETSNALLAEAEHVRIRFLPALQICGMKDYLFLRELNAIEAKAEDYLKHWLQFVSETKQAEKQT